MSTTYAIYYTSGDRLRTASGQETFTAREAADIVTCQNYAWIDRDGDIITGTYWTRTSYDGHKPPLKGYQMAARLRGR